MNLYLVKVFELFGSMIPSIPDFIRSALQMIGVASWLEGLIVDGIVAGVGAVLGFVPQMLVLFFFLAYFRRLWLYGKSCIYHGSFV